MKTRHHRSGWTGALVEPALLPPPEIEPLLPIPPPPMLPPPMPPDPLSELPPPSELPLPSVLPLPTCWPLSAPPWGNWRGALGCTVTLFGVNACCSRLAVSSAWLFCR